MEHDKIFPAWQTGKTNKAQTDPTDAAFPKGFGSGPDDYMEREIDLNEALIGNKPATFFMRVSSDAMKEAGIYNGDVAIVDRSLKATNGKVIIAVLNGDLLIRRFEKTKNAIRLVTDSGKLSPILIDTSCEEFGVWGVVTYVIHAL
jgi:DNA polymerase V